MKKRFTLGMFAIAIFCLSLPFGLMSANAQKGATDIDVQHYKIDAELVPASQLLRARAEVKFIPLGDTRSVVFELNGSLSVKRVTRVDVVAAAPGSAPRDPKAKPAKDPKPSTLASAAAAVAPATGAIGAATANAAAIASDGLQFIQDNRDNMNVRIDLGAVVPGKQPVTLLFEYEGALESPQGGPISNARLAYVEIGRAHV